MAIQNYTLTAGRINKLKGEILAHAVPVEVLGITGQQKTMPKNVGDTVVYRRWLPYGAANGSFNTYGADPTMRFFSQTATGDRAAALTQAHLTQEGVTPPPDSLVPQDISVVLQQYSVLYGVTDRITDLYEDDVPGEMKKMVGERMGLVREMIRYGVLKAGTNVFYGGTGTSRATANGKITLNLLRKISRSLRGNHAASITQILAPTPNFATQAIEGGYLVFLSTDGESDVRDLPGFTPVAQYGSRKPINEFELGSVENFRFIVSPELVPQIGSSGQTVATGATGLLDSTAGGYIDLYPVIVTGENAWGQLALRGANSLDVSYIPAGQKDTADPLGQRGYIGAKFYGNAVVLAPGWYAVAFVGVTSL